MKKLIKVFGIIALAAIIGFSMAACKDDDDGGTKGGLAAPTGLTATPYSSSSVILTWNTVPGATGYNVYNGTSPGNLNGPGAVSSNYANNYNLPANTTVYYQIAAYNASGEGPRSNVVSATTLSNGSMNGVWEYRGNDDGYGAQMTVNGSTGVWKKIGSYTSPATLDAISKGYYGVGVEWWRNITSTGNLTWSGQTKLTIYNTSNPNVATGTGWYNCTFTMSTDGQTLNITFPNNYGNTTHTYTRIQ
jgi:hypothetical protein